MNEKDMIAWIDNASYTQLLFKWRFAEPGHPVFMGKVGEHYAEVMAKRRAEIGEEEHTQISKFVGWKKQ